MIGRSGERGSGISVLAARHDDDDDIYIYIYVCVCLCVCVCVCMCVCVCIWLFLLLLNKPFSLFNCLYRFVENIKCLAKETFIYIYIS